MNTKKNRRFRDNELRMEAVMLELMKTTEPEKITVKRICEKAQVNRTTFYAHFADINDMMDKMESRLGEELLESYQELEGDERKVFSDASFSIFLRHIRRHRYFYRIALKTRRNFPLKQGFEPLWNQIVRPRCKRAGITSEEEMMYYFVYFQAGFTMVLRRWVENGCEESEEALAEVIKNCVPAIWSAGKERSNDFLAEEKI